MFFAQPLFVASLTLFCPDGHHSFMFFLIYWMNRGKMVCYDAIDVDDLVFEDDDAVVISHMAKVKT